MKPSPKFTSEMLREAMRPSDPQEQRKNLRRMHEAANMQGFGGDVTAATCAFSDEAVQKAMFAPASNLSRSEAFAALEYAGITSIKWSDELDTEFMRWQFNITTGE